MGGPLFDSMSLIDASGYVIIATIIGFLLIGIALTGLLRARYNSMERDLAQKGTGSESFDFDVLNRVVRQVLETARLHRGEINTQVIIDYRFQADLKGLLVAERFVKATTGLMIILGLVGTFYGLTLSIGKLVALVSGDVTGAEQLTTSLTRGLTDALSGMSVAFSTSLVGIVAAIVMTLLSVFANVTDKRTAVMMQLESYVDNVLLTHTRNSQDGDAMAAISGPGVAGEGLERLVAGFGQSVARLETAVSHFESALESFAGSTREFQEFNLHLKDNIQRMSLSFADLSSTLQRSTSALKRDH